MADTEKNLLAAAADFLDTGLGFIDQVTDDDKQSDTEDVSEISQGDKEKLQSFIFQKEEFLEYPSLVGAADSEYQPHSVRFFINARENSRVAQLTNAAGVSARKRNWGPLLPENQTTNTLEFVDKSNQNNLTADEAGTLANVGGAFAGAALGLSIISSKSNVIGKAISAAGVAALGAGGVNAFVETTRTVRTLGVIELHIAAPPTVQYSANWENKELGALAGLTKNAKGGDGTFESLLKNASGIGELGLRSIVKAAANIPSDLGIAGELGAAFDLASGKVANPYKEQLFSNIGFRQFAFNYKFNPRNYTELQNVERIIKLFKYHMHPENDPTGLFLEYPSEFNIEYIYRGKENKHLNKISTCALTDIKITYGNQDAFTSIKGQEGAPAEINMQLAFTELETLTNDRIADGY